MLLSLFSQCPSLCVSLDKGNLLASLSWRKSLRANVLKLRTCTISSYLACNSHDMLAFQTSFFSTYREGKNLFFSTRFSCLCPSSRKRSRRKKRKFLFTEKSSNSHHHHHRLYPLALLLIGEKSREVQHITPSLWRAPCAKKEKYRNKIRSLFLQVLSGSKRGCCWLKKGLSRDSMIHGMCLLCASLCVCNVQCNRKWEIVFFPRMKPLSKCVCNSQTFSCFSLSLFVENFLYFEGLDDDTMWKVTPQQRNKRKDENWKFVPAPSAEHITNIPHQKNQTTHIRAWQVVDVCLPPKTRNIEYFRMNRWGNSRKKKKSLRLEYARMRDMDAWGFDAEKPQFWRWFSCRRQVEQQMPDEWKIRRKV